MANLKKKNPETGQWETWASSSASGVYSVNPNLFTEEDQQYITVDDALQRDREDIDMLKKNIAWLAIHGTGGGSDGGQNIDINAVFTDSQYNAVDQIAWRSDSNYIFYQITSNKASNRFRVTISQDGTTVYDSGSINVTAGDKYLRITNIKRYSSSDSHTFKLTVIDNYDNQVSTTLSVVESNIILSKTVSTNTVNYNELSDSSLILNYRVSMPGQYILYYGTDSSMESDLTLADGDFVITVSNTNTNQLAIPYGQNLSNPDAPYLIRKQVAIGQTIPFYFSLIGLNDSTLRSNFLTVPVSIISPSEIAIQPISLSADLFNKTVISKTSVLYSNFIAYLSSVSPSYYYTISAYKIEKTADAVYNETGELITPETWQRTGDKYTFIENQLGQYGTPQTVMYNGFSSDEFFEEEGNYEIEIYVVDYNDRTKTRSSSSYIWVSKASTTSIPLNADEYKIFDFKVYGDKSTSNTIWQSTSDDFEFNLTKHTLNTTIDLVNMGGKSKRNDTHYRFTNKAYGIINQTTKDGEAIAWFPEDANAVTSGLITSSLPKFTLSIAYFADYTPDDDRTIFNFGNLIPPTTTSSASGSGILINNHRYYIRFGGESPLVSGVLQDDTYHQLDIVYGRTLESANKGSIIEVYHNGVLLNVQDNVNASDIYDWHKFTEMQLACKKIANEIVNHTNVNVQAISLYNTAFNPYQIVCNYINRVISYKLVDNNLDLDLLDQKLRANMITYNSETETYTCPLWSDNQTDFNTRSWVEINNNVLEPISGLIESAKLPIVILDFNSSSTDYWTWDAFRTNWASSSPTTANVPFYFFGEDGTNKTPGINVTVSGQGTSSMKYNIKNLNIDFEDKLFWAKPEWFPEKTYTLKADVVDSAHANNAAIGRFVNACSASSSILEPTPAMNYFTEHRSEFSYPSSASEIGVKHTLEGFPVLLLARFASDAGNDVHSLGIYSFNLGREAYYNMGFKLLTKFRNIDGEEVLDTVAAPCLLGNPNEQTDVIDFGVESWEGKDSVNCSEKTEATIEELNQRGAESANLGYNAPVQLDGFFWSSLPGSINHLWERKYPESGTISEFQKLCQDLVIQPYTKGDFHISTNNRFFEYDYDGTKGSFIPNNASENLTARLGRNPYISITNARFYYVVCMLFGLVDSLGKNLNMRHWRDNTNWFTCFYDMDTALGIDNAGGETIDPDVFDEGLENNPTLVTKFLHGNANNSRKIYTVFDNKLWGILDDPEFKDQYGASGGTGGSANAENSAYAMVWNTLRSQYIQSAKSFMDNYFGMQVEGVGELLYNQDFFVKYVNTAEKNFMHGDRQAFVYDWIRKRIAFLDSMFGYKHLGSESYLKGSGIKDCSYTKKVSITHDSGIQQVPITTNAPAIITSVVGGINSFTYYIPANTTINVTLANAGNAPNIQTTINNSDLILNLGNLPYLKIRSISPEIVEGDGTNLDTTQYGSLSGFSELNLAGNTYFNNDAIDFIKLFKTWNEGGYAKPYSLTEIDLSNTKSSNVSQFALNLKANNTEIYTNPFENLTSINLSNSCVTSVSLPEGVSLFDLKLDNSAVTTVTLEGQSVLETVDFTGCNALRELTLSNCSKFKTLNLTNLPSLTTVRITNCPELETININMNNSTNNLTVTLVETPGLKTFRLNKCYGTESSISLTGATNLETLALTDCQFEKVIISSEAKQTIKTLNFNSSAINRLFFNSDDYWESEIDLSEFTYINNNEADLDFRNSQVRYIRFRNDENNPIKIKRAFTGCTKLYRVYGHIDLATSGIFNGCSLFSVFNNYIDWMYLDTHQSINPESAYIEDSTYGSNGLYSSSYSAVKYQFQNDIDSTNITISTSNASYMFAGTKCALFDISYILYRIGAATNISHMFDSAIRSATRYLPRTLFSKCGNVTNVSYLFYNCSLLTKFKIFTHCEVDGKTYIGLLEPLKKCSNFYGMFLGTGYYYTDDNVFYLPGDQKYNNGNEVNVSYFNPRCVVNSSDPTRINNVDNIAGEFEPEIGVYSTKKLWDHLIPSKSLIGFLYSTAAIDFNDDTWTPIPNVTSVTSCFRTSYGCYGTLELPKLFATPSNVENIYQSFTTSASYIPSTMKINENSLSEFINLKNIGYINNSVSQGTQDSASFEGFTKIIEGSVFPYDLLRNCPDLSQFVGFFKGAKFETTPTNTTKLPGTLFRSTPNITDIANCFRNFGDNFELTSDGFVGCTSLQNCRGLFASTHLIGKIPLRLFNVGLTTEHIVIKGTNTESKEYVFTAGDPYPTYEYNERPTSVIVTEYTDATHKTEYTFTGGTLNETNVVCTPLTTVLTRNYESRTIIDEDSTRQQWVVLSQTNGPAFSESEWNVSTDEIDVSVPIATPITNLSECFLGVNIDPFSVTDDEIVLEDNPNYCPFSYVYTDNNSKWSTANRNPVRQTIMWTFDGNWGHSKFDSFVWNSIYLPDLSNSNSVPYRLNYFSTTTGSKTTFSGGTMLYIMPPDLLRWCSNVSSLNIDGLFKNAGHTVPTITLANAGQGVDDVNYGIKGRICPYLLYPVHNLTSVKELFRNCNSISGYCDNNSGTGVYMIPSNFFTFAPNITNLVGTFAGTTYGVNPSLSEVFMPLKGSLNVTHIFAECIFTTNQVGRSIIQNVFVNNDINRTYGAFAMSNMSNIDGLTSSKALDTQGHLTLVKSSPKYANPPITFSNIFKSSNRNKANDYFVFDGWVRTTSATASTGVFDENPHTVEDTASRYNYRAKAN